MDVNTNALKKKPEATAKDMTFAVVFAVLSILLVDWGLFSGLNAGFSYSFTALIIASFIYFGGTKSPFGLISGALDIAAAFSFMINNDARISFFTVVIMIALTVGYLSSLAKLKSSGSVKEVFNAALTVIVNPFIGIGAAVKAFTEKAKTSKNKNVIYIFLGLCCAVPLCAVIVPLLMSADDAFNGILKATFLKNPTRLFGALALGLIIAVYLFCQHFALKNRIGKNSENLNVKAVQKLNKVLICTVLGIISFFYCVYLFSQLAYFVSSFSGVLPKNFTFAEYARRGFFESFAICVINLLIVTAVCLFIKRDGKIPIAVKILLTYIELFSAFLTVTAFAKMYMYISAYGMTYFRVLVSIMLLITFVLSALMIIKIFIGKIPYLKIAVISVALILTAVSFIGIDRMIIEYNVSAFENGKIKELDVESFNSLSVDSSERLVYILNNGNEKQKKQAAQNLESIISDNFDCKYDESGKIFFCDFSSDFRSYNVSKQKAVSFLKQNQEKINSKIN